MQQTHSFHAVAGGGNRISVLGVSTAAHWPKSGWNVISSSVSLDFLIVIFPLPRIVIRLSLSKRDRVSRRGTKRKEEQARLPCAPGIDVSLFFFPSRFNVIYSAQNCAWQGPATSLSSSSSSSSNNNSFQHLACCNEVQFAWPCGQIGFIHTHTHTLMHR